MAVQRNLTKIEGNVRELEAKLKHEQDKFKTYNKDLKEAENRHADMAPPAALLFSPALHKSNLVWVLLDISHCCWASPY